MAQSITDVYGKYTFTATMTVAEGQDASKLSDNCNVTISKDASNIYLAYIDGIAGSTKGGHAVSTYANDTLVIKNMNDFNTGNFDGNLFFSTVNGLNPFGGKEMPDWKLGVNQTTGEISIPDFSIVSIASYEDSLGTIVATFTNAKLTLVEKEKTDIPDITGNYAYVHGEGTYDYNHDSSFSPDYTFTLTKADDATNKTYKATFNFDNNYSTTLDATFDGVTVKAPFDSIYFGEKKDSIRLGSINGLPKGEISFSYVKAGVLSAYSGFCIARDSISEELKDSTFQWFINGKAKDPSQEKSEEVDFTGTYTVVAKYMDATAEWAVKDETFTFTVAKDEYGYYIPVWGEFDEIPYGGLGAKVGTEDSNILYISPSYLKFVSTEEETSTGVYKYITMTDMNGQYNNIALTKNADGTYKLSQFCTGNATYGVEGVDYLKYYSEITSVTKGEEPKPAPVTIAGTYKYTGTYCTMDDPTGVEKSFTIKIEENSYYEQYDGNKYLVTEFDGTDISDLNYGGAGLTVSDETTFPITCTLKAGTLQGGSYPAYQALYDINGSEEGNSLTMTLNEDGTCAITDFSIYVAEFDMETYSYKKGNIIGWYGNGKLERDTTPMAISNVKAASAKTVSGMYDLSGRKATGNGLRVMDGKVMFVK